MGATVVTSVAAIGAESEEAANVAESDNVVENGDAYAEREI